MKKYLLFIFVLVAVMLGKVLPTSAQNWLLTGNSDAAATSKLGTTNNIPLRFVTTNVERMRIDAAGRIAIGTPAPNASALLDISSLTKGILIPRMSQAHRNAINFPVTGLLIFQTDGTKGFYYYDGAWKPVAAPVSGFANTALSNLGVTRVNVDLFPGATDARDIGSGALGWKSLYLTGDVYMNGTRFLSAKGQWNTFLGIEAGKSDASCCNTAVGALSLSNNVEGNTNSAFGVHSLENSNGNANTAIGESALRTTLKGDDNTAVGKYAMSFEEVGYENTAIGYSAGNYSNNPSYCTFLGGYASGADSLYNSTVIGSRVVALASNTVRIGNDDITSIGGIVDWTSLSDARFKKNLNENVPGLAFINELRPVTYTLDIDGLQKAKSASLTGRRKPGIGPGSSAELPGSSGPLSPQQLAARDAKEKIVYTGFVAQEVEKAAKALDYEFSGVDAPKNDKDFYGLRYSEFVVPLVKAVQELDSENKKLREELEELRRAVLDLKNGGPNGNNASADISAYLEQNAPNPFTNTTLIRYHIPAGSIASALIITNMKGQVIKKFTLASTVNGQITINSGVLSVGTYNYTLLVDGKQRDTKQFIVTR